jgi:hypothetical protein
MRIFKKTKIISDSGQFLEQVAVCANICVVKLLTTFVLSDSLKA